MKFSNEKFPRFSKCHDPKKKIERKKRKKILSSLSTDQTNIPTTLSVNPNVTPQNATTNAMPFAQREISFRGVPDFRACVFYGTKCFWKSRCVGGKALADLATL